MPPTQLAKTEKENRASQKIEQMLDEATREQENSSRKLIRAQRIRLNAKNKLKKLENIRPRFSKLINKLLRNSYYKIKKPIIKFRTMIWLGEEIHTNIIFSFYLNSKFIVKRFH